MSLQSPPTSPKASPSSAPAPRSWHGADTPRGAAKNASSLLVNVPERDGPEPDPFPQPIPVTLYSRSARIHWPSTPPKPKASGNGRHGVYAVDCPRCICSWGPCPGHPEAGRIESMSAKSRRRAVFAFLNAPHPWSHLVTLTFPDQPRDPRAAFDRLTRDMRERHKMNHQWGWVMEYQRREVVHYHLFLGRDWIQTNGYEPLLRPEPVSSEPGARIVDRGLLDRYFVAAWIQAARIDSKDFIAFQKGGIVEPFRSPDAAARYVAKEAGKREQKRLPEGIEGGRRWWYLSPAGTPKIEKRAHLSHYPLDSLYGCVFDRTQLEAWIID